MVVIMENGCHIMSMQIDTATLLPTFDRSVHSEEGACIAELVDELLRLHGRVMNNQKSTQLGSSTQAFVLAAVVLAQEPPTVARIARSLGFTRQAIQKVADALESEGYVLYADNPHHKRSRQLLATEQGRQVYDQVNRESVEWTNQAAQGLESSDLQLTLQVLRRVRKNLEAYAEKT